MDCIHEPEVSGGLATLSPVATIAGQHSNSLIGVCLRIGAHGDPQELLRKVPAEPRQIVQFEKAEAIAARIGRLDAADFECKLAEIAEKRTASSGERHPRQAVAIKPGQSRP